MELPPMHHVGHPLVSSVAAIVNDQDVVGPQGPLGEVYSVFVVLRKLNILL
jgi:hypothetical protein